MKICVIGDKMLAKDFDRLNFTVINKKYEDFKIEYIFPYDVIINTYNYGRNAGEDSVKKMVECNINIPMLLSEFCEKKRKRLVHMSNSGIYTKCINKYPMTEEHSLCAHSPYMSSKLIGESVCIGRSLIIRTQNLFNDTCVEENALYRAIINSKPTTNMESFTWTVDAIRGIVAILKKKKKGIFNITSEGVTSQADICNMVGIKDIAPCTDDDGIHYCINNSKLNQYFIPTNSKESLLKCYTKLVEELEK
jgi:nucleoside-diphosphate-sugar epimerase